MSHSSTLTMRVQMLDNSVHMYDVKTKSLGSMLLQAVMKDLNLLEADYFGLLYRDGEGNDTFLDSMKTIREQILNISMVLKFVVKFFPPDPGQLQEEYTRYLFALQIKQDISNGLLTCSENSLAVMASYIAQSEFGDWNAAECSDLVYLRDLQILPPHYYNSDIYSKISERHKTNMGQSAADADSNLLDIARRVESYGIRTHPAIDPDNTEISLAVTHMGVTVLRENAKVNTFNWACIRKLSFKKKRFLIKLKAEINQENYYSKSGDILIFVMKSRDACKTFWRRCIEYHAFFRLESRPAPKTQARVLKKGSTFRYSGKTQKQLRDLAASSNFRRVSFTRVSRRKSTAGRSPGGKSWTPPVVPLVENASNGRLNDATPVASNEQVAVEGKATEITSLSESQQRNNDDTPLTSSKDGITSWQVESENLHSGSDAIVSQQTPSDVTDNRPAEPRENDLMKNEEKKEVSPVHLHSGGISELPKTESPSLPTKTMTPSLSLISTRELKPTISASEMRHPSSQTYFIAKEILMTERTHVKDLEVVCKWFKEAVYDTVQEKSLVPDNLTQQLFGDTEHLLSLHKKFLLDLEERFASWEGRGHQESSHNQRIDDLLLRYIRLMGNYLNTIENGETLISSLEKLGNTDPKFETIYREFELQNICYLPFSAFLLKPMQRISHYKIILDNMVSHQSSSESSDLQEALNEVTLLFNATQERLKRANNVQKMAQLRRDLIGVDFLLSPNRVFIREGSLYKFSRKGFQQRLFFLFSDCLLYTSKGVTGTNQFKVHAELPLKGMIIEINDIDDPVPNCFSIITEDKTVIVAAATQEEMDKWLEDFRVAIANASWGVSNYESPLTNTSRDSMSRLSTGQSSEEGDSSTRNSMEGSKPPTQQRSNATMHVCWHRNTSVSAADHMTSLTNQLSGYLLRKFKNSNGWQKLWVVFSNFCLFFYKSCQDDSPLASLPLLGYTINSPTENDGIKKEFVFKLQFKTHVYFFRAESQYTFSRWIQVISSATVTSQRTRLFSRMDSDQ